MNLIQRNGFPVGVAYFFHAVHIEYIILDRELDCIEAGILEILQKLNELRARGEIGVGVMASFEGP